jgi:hypothetical protein
LRGDTHEEPADEENENDTREARHLPGTVFAQPRLKDEDPDSAIGEHDDEESQPGKDCLQV